MHKNNVNTVLAIFFVAFAVVFIVGLVVIPALQEAQAANAISESDRKKFDEMWDIPRLYASACSNSVQLVPLHPIIMSILFHHYKELK